MASEWEDFHWFAALVVLAFIALLTALGHEPPGGGKGL